MMAAIMLATTVSQPGATLTFLACLFYHAWVGMRDIWMDYIKPAGVRLVLQVGTIVWLVACGMWALKIFLQ